MLLIKNQKKRSFFRNVLSNSKKKKKTLESLKKCAKFLCGHVFNNREYILAEFRNTKLTYGVRELEVPLTARAAPQKRAALAIHAKLSTDEEGGKN